MGARGRAGRVRPASGKRQDEAFAEIAEQARAEGFASYDTPRYLPRGYLRELGTVADAFPEGMRPTAIALATSAGTPAVYARPRRWLPRTG